MDFFPDLKKTWSELGYSCTKFCLCESQFSCSPVLRRAQLLFSSVPMNTLSVQAWGQARQTDPHLTAQSVLSYIFSV